MSNLLENNVCMMCRTRYSDVNKCLKLPCGHEYCKECLTKQFIAQSYVCKSCNKSWSNIAIADLPVVEKKAFGVSPKVFSFGMPVKNEASKFCFDDPLPTFNFFSNPTPTKKCPQHPEKDVLFWCGSCEVTGCKECLRQKHKKCDWQFIEDSEEDCRKYIDRNREETCGRMHKIVENIDTKLSICKDREKLLQEFQKSVADVQAKNKLDAVKLATSKKKVLADLSVIKEEAKQSTTADISKFLSQMKVFGNYGDNSKIECEVSTCALWDIMHHYQVRRNLKGLYLTFKQLTRLRKYLVFKGFSKTVGFPHI